MSPFSSLWYKSISKNLIRVSIVCSSSNRRWKPQIRWRFLQQFEIPSSYLRNLNFKTPKGVPNFPILPIWFFLPFCPNLGYKYSLFLHCWGERGGGYSQSKKNPIKTFNQFWNLGRYRRISKPGSRFLKLRNTKASLC